VAIKEHKDTCNLCRFFSFGERMGICKRYPVVQNKSNEDWCGEWQPLKNHVIEAITTGLTFTVHEEQPKKKPGRPKKS
jgi:hypothetical protein